MGSMALTAPDSWGFLAGSTLYGGAVNGYNSGPNNQAQLPLLVGKAPYPGANSTSYYGGATVATPWKLLRLGAAWDWLELHDWPGQTWAIGGYASLPGDREAQLSRSAAKYLKDSSHVLFAAPDRPGPGPDCHGAV